MSNQGTSLLKRQAVITILLLPLKTPDVLPTFKRLIILESNCFRTTEVVCRVRCDRSSVADCVF
jgi:hypothetical protein